eukprot:CAMPEP_0195109516 /NCGR_PEP_ID=MMETSP0448-20130528/89658_1 /TAXON_ID=66468 /ORGANISM="Heterocapsa triquestra, Strain CCMP 448" /LENGTH=55 /DNA_ID=CAMNT_0040146137 /DNA_START=98 /DNA_END=261 /DNA_ORIENTATION=-
MRSSVAGIRAPGPVLTATWPSAGGSSDSAVVSAGSSSSAGFGNAAFDVAVGGVSA